MKSYIRSLLIVIPKLRRFWLFLLGMGLVCAVGGGFLSVIRKQGDTPEQVLLEQFMLYGGGALVGFATNGYFSCREQFLLRGVKDPVYLVQNPFLNCFKLDRPRVYELADNETVNAFGGKSYEIFHVSESMIEHFYRFFHGNKISLKDATLYIPGNERSVYAVLLGTRYGIPDPPTRERIWGDKLPNGISSSELDKELPGRDLVRVEYWPKGDQGGQLCPKCNGTGRV